MEQHSLSKFNFLVEWVEAKMGFTEIPGLEISSEREGPGTEFADGHDVAIDSLEISHKELSICKENE